MGKCRPWVNVAMGKCRMGICRMGICRLTLTQYTASSPRNAQLSQLDLGGYSSFFESGRSWPNRLGDIYPCDIYPWRHIPMRHLPIGDIYPWPLSDLSFLWTITHRRHLSDI